MNLYYSCLGFFLLSYLPFLNQVGPILNGLFALILLLTFIQERERKTIPKVLRLGLMLSGLALIFQQFNTLWGLEPGVAVLSLMGCLKMFELKNQRDLYLFMLIAELGLVGHVLTVDDLYMVLYVVFLSVVMFALLNTIQGGKSGWTKARKKTLTLIFLYSLPLAGFLFFLFPRLPLGNLFFNTVKKVNYTGFSEELRPGEIAEVVNTNIPYFRAKFLNDRVPTYFELYWRGTILSQTDGFKWKRVRIPAQKKSLVKGPEKFKYLVSFDQFMNSPLFLLEDSFKIKTLSRGHSLNLGEGTFKFFPYTNQKISYSASTGKSSVEILRPSTRKHFLQLPPQENAPRFFEWTRSQSRLMKDKNLRKASSLFQKQLKDFSYSLSPGKMSSNRPLDDFFFKKKVGFCEHFSAAFALYLRILGIPSRVVVGFHGGEYNPLGKYYLVKGQDAHAWVEAWNENKGWVRIDPTNWVSPDRIRYGASTYFIEDKDKLGVSMDVYLDQKSNEFWQGLFFAIDMLYYEANREFVGFDLDRQKRLFDFLGEDNRAWPWKLLGVCLFVLLVFVLPLFLYFKKDRLTGGPVSQGYRLLRKKLRSAGLPIEKWFGPKELHERAVVAFPANKKELDQAFSLYQAIVYGKGAPNEGVEHFCSVVKRLNLQKIDNSPYPIK